MKSLKIKALEWIDQHSINDKEKALMDCPLFFEIEEFSADKPVVYIKTTYEGLEFGYEGTQWLDGLTPYTCMFKKHTLIWEDMENSNREKQHEVILNLLMKTINSRKRQYRKCQFCGEKVAVEHRYDKDTCHSCASENFGVVY